jgi:hypothetical protein
MQPGSEQYLIGVDVPNPRNGLLMHEEGLQSAVASLDDPEKVLAADCQWIAAESPGEIVLKLLRINQRNPAKAAGIPVAQFRFPAPYKRQAHVDVLREPRGRRPKQKEPGHAELSDEEPGLCFMLETQGDTLAESLGRPQDRTEIPSSFAITFAHDIDSTDPGIGQGGSQEASANLPGDNFSFGKFGHDPD